MQNSAIHSPGGQTVVFAVIVTAVLATFVTFLSATFLSDTRSVRQANRAGLALQLAEAGIDRAMWCLNHVASCPSPYTSETATLGAGSYSITLSTTGNRSTVTSTGTVSGVDRIVRVTLQNSSSANANFYYGLQAGNGGITMDNNAKVIGNVYSNGSVIGTNNAEVTGDAILAVGNASVNVSVSPTPYRTTIFGSSSFTNQYVVQSFQPTRSEKVYEVDLKVSKIGSPNDLRVEIRNDSAGEPGNTVYASKLLNSGSIPSDTPSGWENGWTEVSMTTSSALTVGTTYWLVLEATVPNGTKYYKVLHSDNDDTVYPNGTAGIGQDIDITNPLCGVGVPCDMAFQIKSGGSFPLLKVSGPGGNPGVGGTAYANTIESTTIAKHACYQNLVGTVKAGGGSETCSSSSTGPVPCTSDNTESGDTPKCHAANPDPEPADFPLTTAQITQMEAQAEAGGITTCSPTCTIANDTSIGPKKYVGDVTLANGAKVILTGTVWVTGKLSLLNNNRITLAESYGANGGIVIAHDPADETNNGKIFLDNNVEIFRNSNTSSNILMIAMNNSDDSVDPAFRAENNVNKKDGTNDDLEALIMYGHNGVVYLGNNVGPREITGKRIHLSNNTEITYTSGLASAVFSSGPGGAWQLLPQTWQEIQ